MIQFQRLLDVCKATEELPLGGFDMGTISCGTVGCCIGNYNKMAGRYGITFGCKPDYFDDGDVDDWDYFGISVNEYYWLFSTGSHDLKTNYGVFDLPEVTQQQALSRLRKFIYYKLHKHELCHDEKYGVSERGRRAEGDQHFARRAVEAAREVCLVD